MQFLLGIFSGELSRRRDRSTAGAGRPAARRGLPRQALAAVALVLSWPAPYAQAQASPAISGNPSATDYSVVGTGWLGRELGLKDDWGVKLGGLWLADTNLVVSGGATPGGWTNNQAFFLGLAVDANKLVGWKGASFGFQFLQFNGADTNEQAGSVAGYNSIVGRPPYNRTELLEAYYLQEMIREVLAIRIGRTIPTYDFGNVLRPVVMSDAKQNIPAVSGLLWTPIFVNASMIGAMMGYYNPGNGVTVNFTPSSSFYVNIGIYDGNRARGVQTGVSPPQFNGYWFNIAEVGVDWQLGAGGHPGQFGIGLWRQTGELTVGGITENGTGGFYLFGSQRVVRGVHWAAPDSSLSLFFQFGANASATLPITQYYGIGATFFGLFPKRTQDSLGIGAGLSRMNQLLFQRPSELMLQAYYQAHLFASTFLQPTVTYVPTPALRPDLPGALATTMRLTVLF